MGRAIHPLSIEQPRGEPLVVPAEDRSTYSAVAKRAAADHGAHVPDYISAAAVLQGTDWDYRRLTSQEMAEIASDWTAANEVLAEGPAPVIYSHHYLRERTVGVTATGASLSFEMGRTRAGRFNLGKNPAQHLTIPMATHLTLHDHAHHRDKQTAATEGRQISLFRPLTVLASGEPVDIARFTTHRWYNHATYQSKGAPGDKLIVGEAAVSAYLDLMASSESREDMPKDFAHSSTLLALAMFQEVGFEPHMSVQAEDAVRSMSIEMAAHMALAGVTEGQNSLEELFSREDITRRLPALNLEPDDTDEVTARALDLVAERLHDNPSSSLTEYSQRNGVDLARYLRAISDGLLKHILSSTRAETSA